MTRPTQIFKQPVQKYQYQKKPCNLDVQILMKLEQFQEQQLADGRSKETVESRIRQLKQLATIADLTQPEQIKQWMSNPEKCKWNNNTKTKITDTYAVYLNFLGIQWKKPKYTKQDRIPFIPTEQEIDLLISGTGKTTSTALLALKETGARIGELCLWKWQDLDTERKTINVTPEKGSNPRIIRISDTLIERINNLSKQHSPNIFQPDKHAIRGYFTTQRKALAKKLNNPRLLKITFHTFRHWKGTIEYHKTLDVKHVQYILGHKNSNSTTYTSHSTTAYMENPHTTNGQA